MLLRDDEFLTPINDRLQLIQRKNGLTFGTDAYLLYAYMRRRPGGVAADLGAGTGVISLLCANASVFREIHAVEIQPAFANLIERNAQMNGLGEKIRCRCADVRELRAADFEQPPDAVFSNPPYMKRDEGRHNDHDEKQIARHEQMGTIGDFCAAASEILKFGGSFYVVYRPSRLAELMCAMRDNGLAPKRLTMVFPTASHAPCLVLVEAKKGGADGLYLTPPLILQEKNGDGVLCDTAAHQNIYENGVFDGIYFSPGKRSGCRVPRSDRG